MMPNPQMKQMLDAIAKASSSVMKSADKAIPCPHCGGPLELAGQVTQEQPVNDQSETQE